jgi:flagellar hook-associated protein 3 FlgL
MIDRVSSSMIAEMASRNLQRATSDLARLQAQAVSLKKIARPSDDPSGTVNAMSLRAQKASLDQYSRNSVDGQGWLSTADTALSSASNLVNKAHDLFIQGANDATLTPSTRESIAQQLEGIRASLLSAANTTYLGRNVFAGNADNGVAFNADYSYNGGSGSVTRRVGDSNSIQVDTNGTTAFGSGSNSVFAELDAAAADLRAGVSINPRIGNLQKHLDTIVAARASVGARQVSLQRATEANATVALNVEAQRSAIEDLDPAQAYTELQLQQVSYQAALAATAKSFSPTLMDFLK